MDNQELPQDDKRKQELGCGAIIVLLPLVITLALVRFFDLSPLWAWLLAINGVAPVVYFRDKNIAEQQEGHRVPESLLLLPTLLGGGMGTLLGMLFFWHKVKKFWFWIVYLLILSYQGMVIYLLLKGQPPWARNLLIRLMSPYESLP